MKTNELNHGKEFEIDLDTIDRRILNNCQEGFPISPRPFRDWAARWELTEEDLIERLKRLQEKGKLSRFGPVINPRALGGNSTLAAIAVPEERFEEMTKIVNEKHLVSLNYRRDHKLNMWFVVSAEDQDEIDKTLQEIREETNLEVLNMPMLEEFYIGVKFEF